MKLKILILNLIIFLFGGLQKLKFIVIRKKKFGNIESRIDVFLGINNNDIVTYAKNFSMVFNYKLTWSDHINQTLWKSL